MRLAPATAANTRQTLQACTSISQMLPATADDLQRVHVEPITKDPCIAAVTQAFGNEQREVVTKPIVRCKQDTGRREPDRRQTRRFGLIIAALRLRNGCANDGLDEINEAGKRCIEARAREELLRVDAVHPWAIRDLRRQHRCGELCARQLLAHALTASQARERTRAKDCAPLSRRSPAPPRPERPTQ